MAKSRDETDSMPIKSATETTEAVAHIASEARIVPLYPNSRAVHSREDESRTPNALTAVYLRERDQIFGFLLRRTGCEEVARDLLQEVWLRIARLSGMPIPDNPAAYVQRIAGNLALDHIRKHGFRARLTDHDADPSLVAESRPGSERALHARQGLDHLRGLIDHLPDRRRDVFMLCQFEGLTAREVALKLNLSHRTVETHYAKAVATLRRKMAEAGLWP